MNNNDLKKKVLSPTESIHSSTSYSEPSVLVNEKKGQTPLSGLLEVQRTERGRSLFSSSTAVSFDGHLSKQFIVR